MGSRENAPHTHKMLVKIMHRELLQLIVARDFDFSMILNLFSGKFTKNENTPRFLIDSVQVGI